MPIPRCCPNNALVQMGRSGKQAPTQTPTPQQKHLPHYGQNLPPTLFPSLGLRHTCLCAACAIPILGEKRPCCCLAAVVLVMIERIIHTTYVFSHNGNEEMLVINKGRFSKTKHIRINDIVKCHKMSTGFGLSQYILLQCGHKTLVSVQPDNADAFIAEIKKRQATQE